MTLPRCKRKPRPIRVGVAIAYVPLTRGLTAIIDVEDVAIVEGYRWYALKGAKTFYAATTVDRRLVLMHRMIAPHDQADTDHRDSNGLNNRKSNLRPSTKAQNQQNTTKRADNSSGFKGVHQERRTGNYVAMIQANRKRVHLGTFPTAHEAAEAYNQAAARLHGEFARS